VIAGLALVAVAFSRNTVVAALGFVLLVWSANYLVQKYVSRQQSRESDGEENENTSRNKGRRRFRRD
jgi:membrane protein implicated in regulation of membrane protease activity